MAFGPHVTRLGLVLVALGISSGAAAQPLAYVLGDRTGTNDLVTVFDTATLARVTSIPVGNGNPSNSIFGGGIAASADGSRVYVVNSDDQTISVISTITNTVIGTWPAGPSATTIVVSPDGTRLYVGNGLMGTSQASVRIIGTGSGSVLGIVSLGGLPINATLGIALSGDGRRLYATGWTGQCSGNTVKVIDTAAGAVVASIPVASFPSALALTPDGSMLYAASWGSSCTGGVGFVSAIDTASNTNLGSVNVGVNPYSLAVTPNGQRVFVVNSGIPFSVSIISRLSNTVTGSIASSAATQHMRDIAFTPDGRRAFAPADNGVAAFDAIANTVIGSVPINESIEGQPRSIVVLPLPPDPPTDLFAPSITGNRVTLQWRAPEAGVVPTGYLVEGGTRPGEVLATLVTGSPLPVYTFSAPSGVFYVRVHALAGGVRGSASNEIRIAVNPPIPPAAPEGLTGLVNGSSIALSWKNSSAAGMPTAIALEVSGAVNTQLTLPAGEAFTFNSVPRGTYELSIRGINAFGSSESSNRVTLTFPGPCSGAPLAPANVRLYKAGFRVYVYWDPPAAGSAPTMYVLTVTGAFTGSVPTTERTLSGTVGPGTYSISTAAANACGEGPSSIAQSISVP